MTAPSPTTRPSGASDRERLREAPPVSGFCINPVGGPNISVEGNTRFCHEHEFLAYREHMQADLAAEHTAKEAAERERDEHELRADRLERERRLMDARVQHQRATLRESNATATRIKELEADRGRAWAKACARKADLIAMARMYGEACGMALGEYMGARASDARADRLAEQVAALEAALKPFCFGDPTIERILFDGLPDEAPGTFTIKMGDIRAARRALHSTKGGEDGEA